MKKIDTSSLYKVLITTSGTGSRLGELTMHTNKSLLTVRGKTVLSYIIESYPKEIPLVITVGYLADQVRQYVKANFSARDISFVTIDPYQGKGSSLAYSMIQAKAYLQCPFIFHCNDSIVLDVIPSPLLDNWDAGCIKNDKTAYNTASYASFQVNKKRLIQINPKGAEKFDYFHIGLVGIKDYDIFWKHLENLYRHAPEDMTLNDIGAINQMILEGISFRSFICKKWFDTGNPTVLGVTQNTISL